MLLCLYDVLIKENVIMFYAHICLNRSVIFRILYTASMVWKILIVNLMKTKEVHREDSVKTVISRIYFHSKREDEWLTAETPSW